MLRPAVPADLPALLAIRDAAGVDALSDPALVIEADLRRLIAAGSVNVWDEAGEIAGFAAVDEETIHLLVNTVARGKGGGRELLATACAALMAAGHIAATLTLAPGGTAERHYSAAGWLAAGETPMGGTVLKKPL
jgi:GNAT superfamily N-acetyltransferase